MQKYTDIDGDSGVDSFEINETSITVKFKAFGCAEIFVLITAEWVNVRLLTKW